MKKQMNDYYPITSEQINFFKTKGYIKLKNVLSKEEINYYEKEISKVVNKENTLHLEMKDRNTYEKAFIQIGDICFKNDTVKELVFSKRLAKIASDLLETDGIRLYHDQALYKEANGGYTPWHVDQYYWPLSTEKTCTVWIPLQETPIEMGPLYFAEKSHLLKNGRDLEISDNSELKIKDILKKAESDILEKSFDLGEVSFHYGWTFHRAGENKSNKTRKVMTIIYMDKDITLKEPENKNQKIDWEAICPDIKPGELIETDITPIIYTKN